MINSTYSDLLPSFCDSKPLNNLSISENTSIYRCLRERHLQAMWLEQKYFQSLFTREGLPITILSPGIWNGEAGPDFLRAHIKIGDLHYKGDIEIHLNDEGWFHHQHHIDKKYNQVILHVGYWKPKKFQSLFTEDGKSLPCTYLNERLTIPESRILKLIDLDLYPYKHFVDSGTCAHALFRNMPSQNINQLFRKAATWRLQQKFLHLQAHIEESVDVFLGGMAMALGYKHNAASFLKLYFTLKPHVSLDESSLLALAIGTCGFFAGKYRLKWLKSIKYQTLAWRYDAMDDQIKQIKVSLNLERMRPANHPIRRLAILVKMVLNEDIKNIHKNLNCLWKEHYSPSKRNWSALRKSLIEAIPDFQDDYWQNHFIFEEFPKKAIIMLMGRDQKLEILVNVFLPLLFHEIRERNDLAEEEAFFDFYGYFPAGKTKKGAYLMHRFFGDHQKSKILRKADMQQGAYQLHRDFCVHYEASCVGCPFVERYNAVFGSGH